MKECTDITDKVLEKADRKRIRQRKDVPRIFVVHCTADDDMKGEDVWGFIRYSRGYNHVCRHSNGCPLPFYSYYIENVDGQVICWHLVKDEYITYHAGIWNKIGLGVAIDYICKDRLSLEKYNLLIDVLARLCIKYNRNPYVAVWGHRELYKTGWNKKGDEIVFRKTCPGKAIDMDDLRWMVAMKLDILGYKVVKRKSGLLTMQGFNRIQKWNYIKDVLKIRDGEGRLI